MTDRIPLDDLTSDQLDTLYERLAKAERAVNLLADAHRRAEQAEAAVDRVRAWIASEPVTARSEFGSGYREALGDIATALDEQQPTT